MPRGLAGRPQRPAAVNLIEGNVRAITALLEELAYGPKSTSEVGEARARWQAVREVRSAGQRTTGHS
jgi:hypothetical protein